MVSYEFLEKLTTSCKTRDDIVTVSGGSVPIEESPLPHHPHDQSWSKKNWVSVHPTHTQPRQGGRPGNDTQEDEKTRARVDKAQWEARWNLRKAFQTLTRTEDLSQDAGEQFQTKFPPHPHDARDPVPPPQPQEPRLEDFLDSVDADGGVAQWRDSKSNFSATRVNAKAIIRVLKTRGVEKFKTMVRAHLLLLPFCVI